MAYSLDCTPGLLVLGEACDDGLGAVDGDGCSANCEVEPGYHCFGKKCLPVCRVCLRIGVVLLVSNRLVRRPFVCFCLLIGIALSLPTPRVRPQVCSDGIVAGEEQCDDGNSLNGKPQKRVYLFHVAIRCLCAASPRENALLALLRAILLSLTERRGLATFFHNSEHF